MKITQALMDELTAQAKASPWLRMNMDLRNSPEDKSQRMLNAIELGSPLPIHRHRNSSETVVCLRGRLVEEFYQEVQGSGGKVQDVQGPRAELVEAIELSPNGPVLAVNIPICQWHTVMALKSDSVILECKNSPVPWGGGCAEDVKPLPPSMGFLPYWLTACNVSMMGRECRGWRTGRFRHEKAV